MPRQEILRINRTKKQAEQAYDRLSRVYDLLAGPFEKKFRDHALKLLRIGEGEEILEVGFGTGDSLRQIAELVGPCRQGLRDRHFAWNEGSSRGTAGKGRPLGQSRA